jgi:hypothetical protein
MKQAKGSGAGFSARKTVQARAVLACAKIAGTGVRGARKGADGDDRDSGEVRAEVGKKQDPGQGSDRRSCGETDCELKRDQANPCRLTKGFCSAGAASSLEEAEPSRDMYFHISPMLLRRLPKPAVFKAV